MQEENLIDFNFQLVPTLGRRSENFPAGSLNAFSISFNSIRKGVVSLRIDVIGAGVGFFETIRILAQM